MTVTSSLPFIRHRDLDLGFLKLKLHFRLQLTQELISSTNNKSERSGDFLSLIE